MKNIFWLNLLFISHLCIADVPNTFTAGMPASASDVNENFSSLDNRLSDQEAIHENLGNSIDDVSNDLSNLNNKIDDLEHQIADIQYSESESESETDSESDNAIFNYPANTLHTIAEELTYTPNESITPGTQLLIGNSGYKIYRFPVKSLANDSLYAVSFPVSEYETYYTYSNYKECYSPNGEDQNNHKTISINGFQLTLNPRFQREYRLTYDGGFSVERSAGLTLCLKLDEYTFLSIYKWDIPSIEEINCSSEECSERFDFATDELNFYYNEFSQFKDFIDDYIDYFHVELTNH